MPNTTFPPLQIAEWKQTRDTLNLYARLLGKVRQALTPRLRHWWHVSLRATSTGLTTTPIPAGEQTIELQLNFIEHALIIQSSKGDLTRIELGGQAPALFRDEVLAALKGMGIVPDIDHAIWDSTEMGVYDAEAVGRLWQALSQIDVLLKEFKGEHRQETSPVQLWPHHFDLAMVWFSGRLIPDQDPEDEEWSDEQMNFGFATGDETVDDAYFYITAYPVPDGWTNTPLSNGAYWLTGSFTGAILPYEVLTTAIDPRAVLLDFFRTVHQSAAAAMR